MFHKRLREKLLDLYLSGDFPKDTLTERKARLDDTLLHLNRERAELQAHLHTTTLTAEHVGAIEGFCSSIRAGLDATTFAEKRRIIELLDVRGKMAVEDDEKVVYVRCLISQQPVLPIVMLPSSSNHYYTLAITARLPLAQAASPAAALFSNITFEQVE